MCNCGGKPDLFDKMNRARELERINDLERLEREVSSMGGLTGLESLIGIGVKGKRELAEDIASTLDRILNGPESGLRRRLEVLRDKLRARETDRLSIEIAVALA